MPGCTDYNKKGWAQITEHTPNCHALVNTFCATDLNKNGLPVGNDCYPGKWCSQDLFPQNPNLDCSKDFTNTKTQKKKQYIYVDCSAMSGHTHSNDKGDGKDSQGNQGNQGNQN